MTPKELSFGVILQIILHNYINMYLLKYIYGFDRIRQRT